MGFKTEYRFRLPRGFVDSEGNLHRDGVMRLATARDEIVPLQDYRVQSNRAYLVIILLSRVVTKLGDLERLNVETIENLFSTDLAYLQEFYRKINEEQGTPKHHVTCPKCAHEFDIDMVSGAPITEGGDGRPPGVVWATVATYPREQLYQEIAYIAYHFHWSQDEILDMEHEERHIWLREIARINREINEARRQS